MSPEQTYSAAEVCAFLKLRATKRTGRVGLRIHAPEARP